VDSPAPIRLPVASPLDRDDVLVELVAAVGLVATGHASRVVVATTGPLEAVAGEALAYAQSAGIAFALARDGRGRVRAVVGPRGT